MYVSLFLWFVVFMVLIITNIIQIFCFRFMWQLLVAMTIAIYIPRFLLLVGFAIGLSIDLWGLTFLGKKKYITNNIYRENIDFLLRTLPLEVSASDTFFAKFMTNSTQEQVYAVGQCCDDTDIFISCNIFFLSLWRSL